MTQILGRIVGRQVPEPSYAKELADLQASQKIGPAINNSSIPSTMTTVSGSPFDCLNVVLNEFAASGLHYTRAQVATFYTSLQTKGFVVLSGISGTGKSKIATGFVEMLPIPSARVIPRWDSHNLIPISVIPDMKKNHRYTIPPRYHNLLPSMKLDERVRFPVSINGKQGTGRLWYRLHQGRESFLMTFHKDLYAEINEWSVGQTVYLDPILNSEADELQEVRITNDPPAQDSAEDQEPDQTPEARNHLFLSVRPDWRDSTSLLGYYNPLTQTYEWTEFLRFIIRAQESYRANDGFAWFVILDEMNLAHVEYYFADLLSVIESGRDLDGWTREPLRLTYPDTFDDEVPPQEMKLPPNLYIIGTVNMDETTHAFSPKVLDRAFTIELSDVDFLNYEIAGGTSAPQLGDAQKQRLLDAFTHYNAATGKRGFAQIRKEEIAKITEQEPTIREYLNSLNRLLQHYRFHFGYRVFDEIAQYLYNNQQNGMMEFIPAFDQAVFMKVLPKFSGSRARLRAPLLSLLAWTLYPANPEPALSSVQQSFEALDLADVSALSDFTRDAIFKVVAVRAMQMLVALEHDGFVSFG
jgi:5-methylcytosine-specific restriction endonuclease McrBC GTP-binding regulatory subunit McrB